MGNGPSRNPEEIKKRYEDLLGMMMPVYYIDKPMGPEMLKLAKNCWNSISQDTSRHFNQMKKQPDFEYAKCIDYFNAMFFIRLFDVHPMARVLFHKKNAKLEKESQNKFLARMLTMALLDIDDQSRWDQTFTKLAEMHNEMGVKAVEYGVIGEILFYTLEKCVGPEAFTVDVHMAWIHVMSRILKTMVPVALKFELKFGSGAIQQQRNQLHEELSEQLSSNSKSYHANEDEAEAEKSAEKSRTMREEASRGREQRAAEEREKTDAMRRKVAEAEARLAEVIKKVEAAEAQLHDHAKG